MVRMVQGPHIHPINPRGPNPTKEGEKGEGEKTKMKMMDEEEGGRMNGPQHAQSTTHILGTAKGCGTNGKRKRRGGGRGGKDCLIGQRTEGPGRELARENNN